MSSKDVALGAQVSESLADVDNNVAVHMLMVSRNAENSTRIVVA